MYYRSSRRFVENVAQRQCTRIFILGYLGYKEITINYSFANANLSKQRVYLICMIHTQRRFRIGNKSHAVTGNAKQPYAFSQQGVRGYFFAHHNRAQINQKPYCLVLSSAREMFYLTRRPNRGGVSIERIGRSRTPAIKRRPGLMFGG